MFAIRCAYSDAGTVPFAMLFSSIFVMSSFRRLLFEGRSGTWRIPRFSRLSLTVTVFSRRWVEFMLYCGATRETCLE